MDHTQIYTRKNNSMLTKFGPTQYGKGITEVIKEVKVV